MSGNENVGEWEHSGGEVRVTVRRRMPIVLVAMWLAASACGSNNPSSSATKQRTGVLMGKAWVCGTFVEGHPLPLASVSVYSGGHRVASQNVPSGTTYTIRLRPGTYLVTNAGMDHPSSVAQYVSVSSRRVSRVDLPNLCP